MTTPAETDSTVTLPASVPPGIAHTLLSMTRDAIIEEHSRHWNVTGVPVYRKTTETASNDIGAAFALCRVLLELGAEVRGQRSTDLDRLHESLVGDAIRNGQLVRSEEDGEPVHRDHAARESRASDRAKARPY